ncbi:MAG: ABC transporter substrate-binding protein [Candidatus Thermoplasmatota archaeon]|nr:ABC transporter substrate-binding protein [Candidatus Thermoplasmatota archaeon]
MGSFKKKDMKASVLAIIISVMCIAIALSGCTQQQEEEQLEIKNPTMIVRYDIGDAKTLDPADAYDTGSSEPIFQIYDTLVTYRGNDTKTFYPSLATDWTVSNDSLTWTFHLREDVKFSNGNDFTAEDVKYSFDRVLIMDAPESGVSWILAQCMDTNSTKIIDDYTVEITLTESYGAFLALLPYTVAAIVDKDYVEAHGGVVAGVENEWMKLNPMGTGPYMLDHWTRATEIVLKRNPTYWGGWGGNHPEQVVIKYADEPATRILALKNGDADFAYLPYTNLEDVINENGIVVHPFDSYDIVMCVINTKATNNEYLAEGEVRKALSYAFDYDTAIETAYDGYASRLAGAIPNGMPYYETQNNGQPYYDYDLTMAEQILDDAGYTKDYDLDDTLYRFNGTTIRIFFNAGNAEREKMAIMFRGALDEIGILSSVIAEGWPQLLHRMYTTDDWDLMFIGWGPDYNDPDDYIFPFIASADVDGDTYNTGYKNDTVDEKLLEAKYSADSAVRAAAYKAAYDIYIQEPSFIFLQQRQYIRPWRDWVQNYSYNPVREWYFYDYYKAYE